jgi:hypothetical protein
MGMRESRVRCLSVCHADIGLCPCGDTRPGPSRYVYRKSDCATRSDMLIMFGVLALFPTGLALYFLRPFEKFWAVLSFGLLAIAVTGLCTAPTMGLGFTQPLLCALISPVVDYGFQDARIWDFHDVFAHPNFVIGLHQHYIAGHDTSLPDLSPVNADMSGLAQLYILIAEHDILRGEAERLAEAAKRYDLRLDITIWPHVWHSWHLFSPQLPEATRALKMLGSVIRQHISSLSNRFPGTSAGATKFPMDPEKIMGGR